MFSVLTEEDADIVEDTKKMQLINFFCNLSTFQITCVSVPFLTSSPPRHGTKTQISLPHDFLQYTQLYFDSLSATRLFGYFWSISTGFLFCFFVLVYDDHFHHTGFVKWKLTFRSFPMSGNRNLGSGCNTRTFLCCQIFPLSSSVTLWHQHTTSVSSSQVLRSHMLEWLAELEIRESIWYFIDH